MNDKEALESLCKMLYVNHNLQLEWGYIEGTELQEIDKELSDYLKDSYFQKDILKMRRGEPVYE